MSVAFWRVFFVMALASSFHSVASPLENTGCSVLVRAFEATGLRIREFALLVDERDVPVGPNGAVNVSCGLHSFTAKATNLSAHTVTVAVKNPNQVVVLGMRLLPISADEPPFTHQGRIDGYAAMSRCRVVRFIPIVPFGQSLDTLVSTSGTFVLEDYRGGKYVVVLLGEDGPCGSSLITLPPPHGEKISVRLQP